MIPNPYFEYREPSPGEKDQVIGNWFTMLLRFMKVDLTKIEARAAEKVGAALSRWWRTKVLRK